MNYDEKIKAATDNEDRIRRQNKLILGVFCLALFIGSFLM